MRHLSPVRDWRTPSAMHEFGRPVPTAAADATDVCAPVALRQKERRSLVGAARLLSGVSASVARSAPADMPSSRCFEGTGADHRTARYPTEGRFAWPRLSDAHE